MTPPTYFVVAGDIVDCEVEGLLFDQFKSGANCKVLEGLPRVIAVYVLKGDGLFNDTS